MPHAILIVEDEVVLAENMTRYLTRHGFEVRSASDGRAGLAALESFKPDLVLLDFNLPGMNGLDVLGRLRGVDHTIKVIMITAHGSVRVAVDAMKAGAYDYLTKPVALGELKLLVEKALGQDRLEGALAHLNRREAPTGLDAIAGSSPSVLALKARVLQLLDAERRMTEGTAAPVLVTGETGTGKELVARALHFQGVRRDRPFVEINCSTIPTHLVESELFGHERGAFTDARERKIGLVEAAHGGTLFLDEIGELDLAVQAKLLKLLEDKTVRRVGSVRDHKVDIRIVAATHRSLDDLVAEGRFRADLLYRLRVVGIEVPPLRRRGRDVLELADRFLAEQERRYGLSGRSFTAEAREALMGHAWPGNVRELRNVVERGVLTAAGDLVDCDDLGLAPLGRDTATSGGAHAIADVDLPWRAGQETVPLEEVERSTIERTLDRFDGNVSLAARALGVTRDTLRYRIRKHELRPTA